MWETFKSDPSQLGIVLTISAICLAIVASVGIKAWRANEADKRETELKLEMVARGMSAEEITRVLAAKPVDSTLEETVYHKKT